MNGIRSKDITVVIPAFNAERYLAEAVGSVRRQTLGPDAPIIVADDGSTDGTAETAERLGVTLIRGRHAGTAAARNAGLARAGTLFVYLLDADDRAKPDAFRLLAGAAEGYGAFGLAEDFVSEELSPEAASLLSPRQGGYPGILPGCSLLRTELFARIGFFDESIPSGETVAWMLALRDSGLPTASLDSVVLERRLHMANTGRVRKDDEARGYAALLRRRLRKT